MAVKKATSAKRVGSAPKAAPAAKDAVKTAAGKSPTKSSAKPAAVKRTARTAAVKNATTKVATKPAATAKSTAIKVAPSKARTVTASTASTSSVPQRLRVRQDETPWTAKELREIRAGLEADIARLRAEISAAESDLAGLMRDAGDGAGDDQADAGTKTFEREQEISLANNAREVFDQNQHALAQILQGTYGICESCGNPIGKNRLLAFPRATLCVPCKSKQERR